MSIVKKAFVTVKNAFIEFWRLFGWIVILVNGINWGVVAMVCRYEYPQFTNNMVSLIVIQTTLVYDVFLILSGTILFLLIGLIKDKWSYARPKNR